MNLLTEKSIDEVFLMKTEIISQSYQRIQALPSSTLKSLYLPCVHHEYFHDYCSGDTICKNCGIVDEAHLIKNNPLTNYVSTDSSRTLYPSNNPFSKITNKKLYSAFFTYRNIEKRKPQILKIFDVISAAEGISYELKEIILANYHKIGRFNRSNHKNRLLVLLLCMRYEFILRNIPFSFRKFKGLINRYTLSVSAAQKALSCVRQYFSEIKALLGWENRPVELSLQIEYVVSEMSTKLSLKNNQLSIRSLAQTIATFYCDIRQMIRQMIPTSEMNGEKKLFRGNPIFKSRSRPKS